MCRNALQRIFFQPMRCLLDLVARGLPGSSLFGNGLLGSVLLISGLLACAIPKDQASFSVKAPGAEDERPFLSTSELRVAGLVSESLGLGAKGRLFDAESRLRRAYAMAPENSGVAFNLAIVLGQQGYFEEALKMLADLRNAQGDLPRLMIAMADVHSAQGDFANAREKLKIAFNRYQAAQNVPQAALVARSIANLAFADGYEQEALCYSYEAFSLVPDAKQLGAQATLMVGLNLFAATQAYVAEMIGQDAARGSGSQVHFAKSLALGAKGDLEAALKESGVALDLAADDPDLAPEVRVVWWLLKREVPETELDPRALEADNVLRKSIDVDARVLQERPTYSMIKWPLVFRDLLKNAKIEE